MKNEWEQTNNDAWAVCKKFIDAENERIRKETEDKRLLYRAEEILNRGNLS